MSIKFCTIASGSSGNSAFVSVGNNKILVDAGLSGKAIEEGLRAVGECATKLTAIFVTHEHSDHVKGAGVLSRRHNVPLYMTAGTAMGADIGRIASKNHFLVRCGVPVVFDGVQVMPFGVPHDANETVGYSIIAGERKISIATDLGHTPPEVVAQMKGSDIILIEANHDIEMLKNGAYPQHLKQRILSPLGHLSNVACGTFLADIICSKTKHIILGHLSEENNRPMLAHETVKRILHGHEVGLSVANRHRPSEVIHL